MSWFALRWASRAVAAGWELRRRAYARGLRRPHAVGARVVSIGNLTVGGTGKTTLTLHLAERARARGTDCSVVVRDYRPGPRGAGDERLMYEAALGASAVFGGRSKLELARRAVAAGHRLLLIDDGFSHWALARDLDLVLLDATDPWGGGEWLPAGRLREPRRALQRAGVVVLSRVAPATDVPAALDALRRYAPAALWAAGRHEVIGVRGLDGSTRDAPGRVRVVTATGNPDAVAASATEAGCEVVAIARYRDHHWFTPAEAAGERSRADGDRATVLLTAKDAVRWPAVAGERTLLLAVRWRWLSGGDQVEARVFGEGRP